MENGEFGMENGDLKFEICGCRLSNLDYSVNDFFFLGMQK